MTTKRVRHTKTELYDELHRARSHAARLEFDLANEERRASELEAKLNTPELHDFVQGVVLEAAHQRERWGSEHDAGKKPQDWFWVVGYLAGKALAAHIGGNTEKALHHTISTAAVLNNWHAAISGASTVMRPGISEEKQTEADDEKSLQESESQA